MTRHQSHHLDCQPAGRRGAPERTARPVGLEFVVTRRRGVGRGSYSGRRSWTSTSASLHRGHTHRNNSRSAGRKRRFERARTPNWWCRARLSSRRSVRVVRA